MSKAAPRLYVLTVEDVTYRPTNAVTALGALWFALEPIVITADAPASAKDRYSPESFLERAQFFRASLNALAEAGPSGAPSEVCLIDLPVYASLAARLAPDDAQAAVVAQLFDARLAWLEQPSAPSELDPV